MAPTSPHDQTLPEIPTFGQAPLVVEKLAEESIEQAVRVHMEAFSGYTNAKLGKPYVRRFLRFFVTDPDAIALAVRVDDDIVGYAVGAPVGYAGALMRQTIVHAMLGAAFHPRVWLDPDVHRAARRKLASLIPGRATQAQDLASELTYSLVGIGTSRSARRRGVGTALLQRYEAEACLRGARRLRLTVYNHNQDAMHLYTKSGWMQQARPSQNYSAFIKQLDDRSRNAA